MRRLGRRVQRQHALLKSTLSLLSVVSSGKGERNSLMSRCSVSRGSRRFESSCLPTISFSLRNWSDMIHLLIEDQRIVVLPLYPAKVLIFGYGRHVYVA